MSSEGIIPSLDSKLKAVLLFGPQGAGKGTVGKMIAQAGSHLHLSSGDIFRGLSPNSPAGKLARSYMDQGKLLPDDVTIQIWHYYVSGLVATNRYLPDQQFLLLDGLPRTVEQAKLLEEYLDVQQIVVLDVENREELITRLQRRAKIEGRVDDADPVLLNKRLETYYEKTTPLLEYYPKERITTFNAAQPPLRVLGDVLNELAEKLTCELRPLPGA